MGEARHMACADANDAGRGPGGESTLRLGRATA